MNLNKYRLHRLSLAAEQAGADMLVATLPANIGYTANGYQSVDQWVLARNEAAVAYLPKTGKLLYIMAYAEMPSVLEHAGADADFYGYGGAFVFEKGDDSYETERTLSYRNKTFSSSAEAWEAAVKSNLQPGSTIAIDESRIFSSVLSDIKNRLSNYQIIDGTGLYMEARKLKHPDEIAGIEKSAEIASESLMASLKKFRCGISAYDMEQLYNQELAKRGAVPFFCVITAGKRAAYSDTTNSKAPILDGEMIRFDFGCIYKSYCSDLARTAFVGRPDSKAKTYFDAVKAGTDAATSLIKPGVTCGEIFEAAVGTTRKSGIPHYRRHHCGHGIGLECYDRPSVTQNNPFILKENMTFCVETPYYELGWGGVQMEDTIVVTKDGFRMLDKTTRDLIILND